MALQPICCGSVTCLLGHSTTSAAPCNTIVWLQKTSTQRALAAMQLAANKAGSSDVDADVAAESAALQSRCRLWIRSQEGLHKPLGPPADGMQGSAKQPQQLLGSRQQPQGTLRSAFTKGLTGLQNMYFRAFHKGGHVNLPRGTGSVPCQFGNAAVSESSTTGSNVFAQQGANSWHEAASDAASANVVAKGGGKEDAGHLRGWSANPAATEKLTPAGVLSVTHHDVSNLQGICTSAELDPVGNDRFVRRASLTHSLQYNSACKARGQRP